MSLSLEYTNLSQFLTGYFPDADLDELTDEEVVYEFVNSNPKEIVTTTKRELEKIIDDNVFFEEIGFLANRYFKYQEEVLEWLEIILLYLNKAEHDK
jgi:hypothetical protein